MGDFENEWRVRTDGRLNDLEANMGELTAWKGRVDLDLYNHGRDGLKTQFLTYVAEQKGRDKALAEVQAERHAENSEKLTKMSNMIARRTLLWTIAGVLVTIAALTITILGVMGIVKMSKTDDFLHLFHSVQLDQLLSLLQNAVNAAAPPY